MKKFKKILVNGDCLEIMKKLPKNSIDLVLVDPPYGTTACRWDSIIPLEFMWSQLKQIIKKDTPMVFMANQPFTTTLISSNIRSFKYCWVWEKNFSTNFLHAKRQPLRKYEDIVVFYNFSGKYYPIKTLNHNPTNSAKGSHLGELWHGDKRINYEGGETTRYPVNIIKINAVDPKQRIHPNQKPVLLMEYLIKTYSNKNEIVLDFCMGSGTTGIACKNLNRKFIGIEKDPEEFMKAKNRIDNHQI